MLSGDLLNCNPDRLTFLYCRGCYAIILTKLYDGRLECCVELAMQMIATIAVLTEEHQFDVHPKEETFIVEAEILPRRAMDTRWIFPARPHFAGESPHTQTLHLSALLPRTDYTRRICPPCLSQTEFSTVKYQRFSQHAYVQCTIHPPHGARAPPPTQKYTGFENHGRNIASSLPLTYRIVNGPQSPSTNHRDGLPPI